MNQFQPNTKRICQPQIYHILQDIRSQTLLNSVNNKDYSDQNLQENFSEES
ncbi:21789_t:CDS:2 [Cetraspora pellucida]|uniref:21789_t:CDS:1 n=1 Tax=Cetraspora pellucida TaxID=1433469 RepID=A0A9N9G953_9GLOM|nr:21789_t:CDS:2 [Cetraspora pellucida]